MDKLIRMADYRARATTAGVRFDRNELMQLLNLYSRRVAGGEWRDYAIDQGRDKAIFAIYRHTLDRPLFTVTKRADEFVIAGHGRELARCPSLAEALAVLDRQPRAVM